MKVCVINKSKNELPTYATPGSAGLDLRANLGEEIILEPGHSCLIPTGLYIKLPEGYEAQVRPRSGLALKNCITVLNSPGTIDSDYTGEIGVILINHGTSNFQIKSGDRIAQMVVTKISQITWEETNELNQTLRGENGFGHTGKD